MDNPIDVEVDQLLAIDQMSEINKYQDDNDMQTGSYDLCFFEADRTQSSSKLKSMVPPKGAPPRRDTLEAASLGLNMFLDEADEALRSGDLTIDQRIHVATIVSMVEGLAARFDRVRTPGFVAKAPMKLKRVSGT